MNHRQNLSCTLEEITGNAQVNVVILYGIFNIKVFDETFEFCELTTCPASKGSAQQLVITAKIPEIFPKVSYIIHILSASHHEWLLIHCKILFVTD